MWKEAIPSRVMRTIQFFEGTKCSFRQSGISIGGLRDRMTGALAQLARASALQAECQGFESLKLHQYKELEPVLTGFTWRKL